ncbi:MAG: ATP synthase F1 subunit delta [Alphaproteobacteria bacterium GM7ARS4]|nr:ATP synthase F1 subunit delta [Alphaproteobacteria bacterium GM7ARS4]
MASSSVLSKRFPLRYARALYGVARKEGVLDDVVRDGDSLQALVETRGVRPLLSHPLLNEAARKAVVVFVGERLGVCDVMRRFLHVLALRGRLGFLPEILEAWRMVMNKERATQRVCVRSAWGLTAAQRKDIEGALKAGYGGDISMEVVEDSSLLSGIVVDVGSVRFDGSLSSQLRQLEQRMQGEAV